MPGISFYAAIGDGNPGAGSTRSLGEVYPITRDSITFGWSVDSTANSRTRNSSSHIPIDGLIFVPNGGATRTFRVDLPAAGTYKVRIALGDANLDGAQGPHKVLIKDGATTLATWSFAATAGQFHRDAAGTSLNGVNSASPNWRDNNVGVDLVFAGTVLNVEVGDSGGSGLTTINRIEWEAVGGGDTTPPTISGSITVGTVTTTSIQMSWPAGADNTAVTSYEVSSNGGGAWSDVGLVLTHTFTGLTAATSYGLRVRPKDAAGNVAVTPLSATQSTASSADTTIPTQSGSITVGTVTSTSIQFSWPAGADNVAVTAYEVSSNGGGAYTVLGNVLTHTFTGLTPSTSYGLRVRAKDAAGNVSTPALAATQSTSAAAPGSGTLTLTGFAQWTGSPVVSVSVPFVKVCRISTGAVVLELTAQAISGAGAMSITNAALSPAVDYMVFGFNADGSASFKKRVTAS